MAAAFATTTSNRPEALGDASLLEDAVTCAVCIRIDHCVMCGAELEPQDEDRCPDCGDEGCLISTWGEGQRMLYKTGRSLGDGPWPSPGPDFDPATHACTPEARYVPSDEDIIPTDAELDEAES